MLDRFFRRRDPEGELGLNKFCGSVNLEKSSWTLHAERSYKADQNEETEHGCPAGAFLAPFPCALAFWLKFKPTSFFDIGNRLHLCTLIVLGRGLMQVFIE